MKKAVLLVVFIATVSVIIFQLVTGFVDTRAAEKIIEDYNSDPNHKLVAEQKFQLACDLYYEGRKVNGEKIALIVFEVAICVATAFIVTIFDRQDQMNKYLVGNIKKLVKNNDANNEHNNSGENKPINNQNNTEIVQKYCKACDKTFVNITFCPICGARMTEKKNN